MLEHALPVQNPLQWQALAGENKVTRSVLTDRLAPGFHLNAHSIDHVELNSSGWLVATGTLPVSCRYFSDAPQGACDPIFLAEFARRAVEVISRLLLEVPARDHFVLKHFSVRSNRGPATLLTSQNPEVRVLFCERQVRRRLDGSAYAVDGPFTCHIDAAPAVQCDGAIAFMPPESYAAARAASGRYMVGLPAGHVSPIAPAQAGKRHADNVLIGEVTSAQNAWAAMLVPQVRPPLYDRPLDHYPGMLMAEAARQLVAHAMGQMLKIPPSIINFQSADMEFASFAGLEEPPVLRASASEMTGTSHVFDVVATQAGKVRASFNIKAEVAGRHGGRS